MIERAARAALHRVLRRVRGGRLELVEDWPGERLGFGPPEAELRAEITIHSPRFYALVARRRSVGLGEAYADGLWDSDNLACVQIGALELRRADAARSARAARPPRPAPRQAAAAQHAGRRAAQHRRPLRPRQRAVRALPRPRADDVLRAWFEREDATLEQAQGGEARADLPARAAPRRPSARDRHRVGRARRARGVELRLPGDDDDDLARAARVRRGAGGCRRARAPGRGPRRRLPRPRGSYG